MCARQKVEGPSSCCLYPVPLTSYHDLQHSESVSDPRQGSVNSSEDKGHDLVRAASWLLAGAQGNG